MHALSRIRVLCLLELLITRKRFMNAQAYDRLTHTPSKVRVRPLDGGGRCVEMTEGDVWR